MAQKEFKVAKGNRFLGLFGTCAQCDVLTSSVDESPALKILDKERHPYLKPYNCDLAKQSFEGRVYLDCHKCQQGTYRGQYKVGEKEFTNKFDGVGVL